MEREKCCIGRGVAGVAHRAGSRSYTYFAMRSLRETFAFFEAEGTVFGSINKADFLSISWLTAPARVVQSFEEQCIWLDSRIEIGESEISSFTSLRDSLLPKLVSGEVGVGIV